MTRQRQIMGWVVSVVAVSAMIWLLSPVQGSWSDRGAWVEGGAAETVDDAGRWVRLAAVESANNNLSVLIGKLRWWSIGVDQEAHERAVKSTEAGVRAASVACGVGMTPYEPQITEEGGSSGLLYALAAADRHFNGAFSQGRRIAATGVVVDGGGVEPVGGIEAKVGAAVDLGVDLIIVPAENAPVAETYAQQVPVVGVRHVADALSVLAPGLCH